VDVTFAPSESEAGTTDVILKLHVDPSGPDYNLALKGVAVKPTIGEVVASRTLALSNTMIGECSKACLDIKNPYPTAIQWKLSPSAFPFLKKVHV